MAQFLFEKFVPGTDHIPARVALFIKDTSMVREKIAEHYLSELNIAPEEVIVATLPYDNHKYKAALAEKTLKSLFNACERHNIEFIYLLDSNYAKKIFNSSKATAKYIGELKDSKLKGSDKQFRVMLGVNYKASIYNEAMTDRLHYANKQFNEVLLSNGLVITQDPLKNLHLIRTKADLMALLNQPKLCVDVEAYSLDFWASDIATVGFGTSIDTAHVMVCDASESNYNLFGIYHEPIPNPERRAWLKEFFMNYKGQLIFHNAPYDAKVLIYNLFMDNLLDQTGLLRGLECLSRGWHDTKLFAYLCLNSTVRGDLDLKSLSLEFMGQYAEEDITDIRKIPLADLVRYNGKDCIATWYVGNKYYPKMVNEDQLDVYTSIFRPSLKVIVQMELQGMPMDMDRVKYVHRFLSRRLQRYEDFLYSHPTIKHFTLLLRDLEAQKANKKLKKLRKSRDDFPNFKFNPGSPTQVRILLFEYFKFEVTDLTDSGQASTKAKVLKKLLLKANRKQTPIIKALLGISEIAIILQTFVTTFIERGVLKDDGLYYLHGNFNLGGTVSGRLSSSGPNMQNLPSTGSRYAKLIKSCFIAPPGWLLVGADFASLEDRISALTTKDPNKLKVYTDGYDGHCLRAYAYFGSQMPDIIDGDVNSINSIEEKYPKLRQHSKGPTFALTYQGTWLTLVNEIGLDEDSAKNIENKYHELYEVSDQWVHDKLEQACKDGYVTVAFGLKVRTPYLKDTILNTSVTPPGAAAEGRTAGNALGQSYGMLNNRAAIEFQEQFLNSKHRLSIKPALHVHDSQYFIIRDDIEVLQWFNKYLVSAMEWQELSEIRHPDVSLGGQVETFIPSWAHSLKLPNGADQTEIKSLLAAFTSNSGEQNEDNE